MDQSELEQRLECLMALRDKVVAKMDVCRETMKEPLKASLVGLDRCIEAIKDRMDANKKN
jgi:hypothetical protein